MNGTDITKSHGLQTIGAILAIITPGAYLLGLNFYQGYLSAFGVESDGFPISTPDIYVFSYQTIGFFLLAIGEYSAKLLKFILDPPVVYYFIFILTATIGSIYGLIKLVKSGVHRRLNKMLTKLKVVASWLHWRNNDFTKSVGIVGVVSYSALFFATSAAAVALFWWLIPIGAHAKGEAIASERIKSFLEKGCHADLKTKWDTCFVIEENGHTIHEGLLIAVSKNEIAIFKKDGSYVFARQSGFLLRRKLHKDKIIQN